MGIYCTVQAQNAISEHLTPLSMHRLDVYTLISVYDLKRVGLRVIDIKDGFSNLNAYLT